MVVINFVYLQRLPLLKKLDGETVLREEEEQ